MSSPIGIFDSGYGGLTVMKEIIKNLPQYDYVYLGDNTRAPYGDRSFSTVYAYTLQSVKWLFQKGCPLVILACNTASAKALRTIQQKDLINDFPDKKVLGVIRPTSEIIGNFSKSGHIGVMGTVGTVQSESYVIEIAKFFPEVTVIQEACPMWVPLVENNDYTSAGADYFVDRNIRNLMNKDSEIDTILLACTHYPLLMDKIRNHTPPGVTVIQQGEIISASLADYLHRHQEVENRCSKGGERHFYTTGDAGSFNEHGSLFFGQVFDSQHIDIP